MCFETLIAKMMNSEFLFFSYLLLAQFPCWLFVPIDDSNLHNDKTPHLEKDLQAASLNDQLEPLSMYNLPIPPLPLPPTRWLHGKKPTIAAGTISSKKGKSVVYQEIPYSKSQTNKGSWVETTTLRMIWRPKEKKGQVTNNIDCKQIWRKKKQFRSADEFAISALSIPHKSAMNKIIEDCEFARASGKSTSGSQTLDERYQFVVDGRSGKGSLERASGSPSVVRDENLLKQPVEVEGTGSVAQQSVSHPISESSETPSQEDCELGDKDEEPFESCCVLWLIKKICHD